MSFMLKFIIPITACLKLSENDLIIPITYPQGVHNHAKNVPPAKPSMG